MQYQEALEILREYDRRYGHLQAVNGCLFGKQIDFIRDRAKRKTARCGRRAGKTFVDAAYLLIASREAAQKFEAIEIICPYIALTKGHARRLLWPILIMMNHRFDLGLEFNETELTAKWPDLKSKIWLTGADRPQEIEKLRGGAYPLVIADEGSSFGPRLGYMIEEVLDASLGDFDGTLAITGTPGASCAGAFYEADTGIRPGWSNHHWTILDNPKFPQWHGKQYWTTKAQRWLAAKRKEKGWAEDNPIYLREWLGRWVRDESSLVYKYAEERNDYDTLPNDIDFEYIIGVDLGYEDASAIECVAFSRNYPVVYEVEGWEKAGLTIGDILHHIDIFARRYNPIRIVVDTGGLGKMIVEEMKKRGKLPLHPAEKKDKYSFIEIVNSDLQVGRVKAKKGSGLADEWILLQWDEAHRKEDDRFKNHRSDAFLYAYREAKHYLFTPKDPLPEFGTSEYWKLERDKMFKRQQERYYNQVIDSRKALF